MSDPRNTASTASCSSTRSSGGHGGSLSQTSPQSLNRVDSVDSYLPSVPFLVGKLKILVNCFLSKVQEDTSLESRPNTTTTTITTATTNTSAAGTRATTAANATVATSRASSRSITEALNEVASSNVHFTNICSLLVDFHKPPRSVRLDTSPTFYVLFCAGYDECDDRMSSKKCSRGLISQNDVIVRTPRCSTCRKRWANQRKREKRKVQNEASWLQPGSSCNWRYLSPIAQQKRRKNRANEQFKKNTVLQKEAKVQTAPSQSEKEK